MSSPTSTAGFDAPGPQGDDGLTLDGALRILRRRFRTVVSVVVICTALALVASLVQTDRFTATSSLIFKSSRVAQQATGVQSGGQTDSDAQRLTNLELVRLAVQELSPEARRLLGRPRDDSDAFRVEVNPAGQSNIVSLAVSAESPRLAARASNLLASLFIKRQREQDQSAIQGGIDLVQAQLDAMTPTERALPKGQAASDRLESLRVFQATQNNVEVARPAFLPKAASSPRVKRNTAIGFLLGCLLGVPLAFLRHRLDRRLRDTHDVEDAYGLPVLGVIPHAQSLPDGEISDQRELEPFRMLRARLRYFNVDRQLECIMVTSTVPSEGKTTVSRQLALAAASTGAKTLLLEADLRRPNIATRLGIRRVPGLVDVIVNPEVPLADFVQVLPLGALDGPDSEERALHVLPAGSEPPNPSELLESQAMKAVLARARAEYDLVVVDTPPLPVVADAIPLVSETDGLIVVARLGVSTRDGAQRLRALLLNLGAPTLGVVANGLRGPESAAYGYGYGYGYEQDSPKEPSAR